MTDSSKPAALNAAEIRAMIAAHIMRYVGSKEHQELAAEITADQVFQASERLREAANTHIPGENMQTYVSRVLHAGNEGIIDALKCGLDVIDLVQRFERGELDNDDDDE